MARSAFVAVFDGRNQAYDAAHAMQQLPIEQAQIFRGAIAVKDDKGNLSVLDSDGVGAPWGTLGGGVGGALVGAMMGLLAGPAGAAAGAAAGTAVATGAAAGSMLGTGMGVGVDLAQLGLDEAFIADVGAEMNPGKAAVLAEVEEGSTEPIDAIVARHGGKPYRRQLV